MSAKTSKGISVASRKAKGRASRDWWDVITLSIVEE